MASGRNKCGSSYYNYCRKTILPEPYTRYNEVSFFLTGKLLPVDISCVLCNAQYADVK